MSRQVSTVKRIMHTGLGRVEYLLAFSCKGRVLDIQTYGRYSPLEPVACGASALLYI